MKQRRTKEMMESMFFALASLSCLTIKKYGSQLVRKNVNGKNRQERFFDYFSEVYQDFTDGKIASEELEEFMQHDVGVKRE